MNWPKLVKSRWLQLVCFTLLSSTTLYGFLPSFTRKETQYNTVQLCWFIHSLHTYAEHYTKVRVSLWILWLVKQLLGLPLHRKESHSTRGGKKQDRNLFHSLIIKPGNNQGTYKQQKLTEYHQAWHEALLETMNWKKGFSCISSRTIYHTQSKHMFTESV
jgi:hypothetical protein